MYTFEQLQGFVAVAEERSFSRAAERLHMTQPPLSRQIQHLEQGVGFELFVRTTRSLRLTPAGLLFLDEARRILMLAEAAPLHAQRVARGTAGRIRVGFTAVSALNVFGEWISAAHERLPGVDFVLTEMVTSAQLDALFAGELDVGFLRGSPRSTVLRTRLVFSEQFVAAVPAGHPLTRIGRNPTLHDLADYGVITYTPTAARYHHELVVALFQDAGVSPDYVQYVAQVNSQLVLVGAGLGVALVPRSAERLRPPTVEILEIDELPDRDVKLHCAWRADSDNPALPAALAVLDEVVDPSVVDDAVPPRED